MSDDKKKVGKPDRDRINVHEDYEVRDAARAMGTTPEIIREAVAKVGNMRADVEAYVRKRTRSPA